MIKDTYRREEQIFISGIISIVLRLIAKERNILLFDDMNDFDVFDNSTNRSERGDITTNAAFLYFKALKFQSAKELSEELAKKINEIMDFIRRTTIEAKPDGVLIFTIKKD